jgi:hypothetical protein
LDTQAGALSPLYAPSDALIGDAMILGSGGTTFVPSSLQLSRV